MDVVASIDNAASKAAFAIGEPARAKILYYFMDSRSRTSTELAAVADVGTSTASAHLDRLLKVHLVKVAAAGRHRYYSLAGPEVGHILEGLVTMAGSLKPKVIASAPRGLRAARTCYDHIAGHLGVSLRDRFLAAGWILPMGGNGGYKITEKGKVKLLERGVEVAEPESRRRVAFGCLDWSERRFHLGGTLGAALLTLALSRKWLVKDLEGRGLALTPFGREEFRRSFAVEAAQVDRHAS